MLRWAFTFLVVALIAGAFGMTGVAGTAAGIAKGLFVAFLALFAITMIAGIAAGRKVSHRTTPSVRKHDDLVHH